MPSPRHLSLILTASKASLFGEISRLNLPNGNAVISNGSDGSTGTHGPRASRTVEVDDVFAYVSRLDTNGFQVPIFVVPNLA